LAWHVASLALVGEELVLVLLLLGDGLEHLLGGFYGFAETLFRRRFMVDGAAFVGDVDYEGVC